MSSFKNKMGALLLKKSIMEIKDYMDYNNYGGGVMLGVKKIIIKGHGSSKTKAIYNCIQQAYTTAYWYHNQGAKQKESFCRGIPCVPCQ